MGRTLASKIEQANLALMVDRNMDVVDQYFTPDYVVHLTDNDLTGHDSIRRVLRMYSRAFTDLEVKVEILVKAKDRVAWQRTIQATHTGSFQGFPATGRCMTWREMVTSRFRDGLIAEDWLLTDLAERLLRARKR